jgi:hypothetical protein
MKKTEDPNFPVCLCVMWGNDDVIVDLEVKPEIWKKIRAGEQICLQGKGYSYEGEKFQDYWVFNSFWDGSLSVSYDGGGEGFRGDYEGAIESQF